MSLYDKIEADFKEALKQKEELKLATLRMLKSALHNLAIENKSQVLDDQAVMSVLKKELKKRQDAIESFKAAGRNDLLEKESQEAKILSDYLPEMMSPDEIKIIIDQVVAGGQKEFGSVMKEVMAKTKGMADGKQVSELVRQKLQT